MQEVRVLEQGRSPPFLLHCGCRVGRDALPSHSGSRLAHAWFWEAVPSPPFCPEGLLCPASVAGWRVFLGHLGGQRLTHPDKLQLPSSYCPGWQDAPSSGVWGYDPVLIPQPDHSRVPPHSGGRTSGGVRVADRLGSALTCSVQRQGPSVAMGCGSRGHGPPSCIPALQVAVVPSVSLGAQCHPLVSSAR